MKIQLLAAGTKPPGWVTDGFCEYQKRMPGECSVELVEFGIAKRSKNTSVDKLKQEEEDKLNQQFEKGARVVALDRSGKQWSTPQLADRLTDWMQSGQNVQLVIGGPDGLSDGVLNRANEHWALSNLTFPHFMVRVLVMEQLYRAWCVIKNHPYHK